MRPGEIKKLTWAAYDQETGSLRLPGKDSKNKHGRVLALVGELREILDRRVTARRLDCPYIFHRQGRRIGDYRRVWKRACLAAGIPGAIPYSLRRTAVRNMIRAGVDRAVAMKISGHRTERMFSRYNIVDDRDLRDAMEKTSIYVNTLSPVSTVVPFPVPDSKHGTK